MRLGRHPSFRRIVFGRRRPWWGGGAGIQPECRVSSQRERDVGENKRPDARSKVYLYKNLIIEIVGTR